MKQTIKKNSHIQEMIGDDDILERLYQSDDPNTLRWLIRFNKRNFEKKITFLWLIITLLSILGIISMGVLK